MLDSSSARTPETIMISQWHRDGIAVPVAGGSSIGSSGNMCSQDYDDCNHAVEWAYFSAILIRQNIVN